MRLMKTIVVAAFALSAGGASAESLDFWGTGSPVTNRVPPVAATCAIPSFSSSVFFLQSFVLSPFYSTPASGYRIFYR